MTAETAFINEGNKEKATTDEFPVLKVDKTTADADADDTATIDEFPQLKAAEITADADADDTISGATTDEFFQLEAAEITADAGADDTVSAANTYEFPPLKAAEITADAGSDATGSTAGVAETNLDLSTIDIKKKTGEKRKTGPEKAAEAEVCKLPQKAALGDLTFFLFFLDA